MPIRIEDSLPAKYILEKENIFVMTKKRANSQDIRPIKIIILNLMPVKSETETQLLRLLSNTPLQVDIELLQTITHKSKNTSSEYLKKFYKTFDNVKSQKFDGMIITGAPVEKIDFEKIDYWDELCKIMEWSKSNVYSTLHICWGAQAALYYHYNIPKILLKNKISGIYSHEVLDKFSPIVRGFDDYFMMPHSRYSKSDELYIKKNEDLVVLAESNKAGFAIVTDKFGRQLFVSGHFEYQSDTLKQEYLRDLKRGLNPLFPENYLKNNDLSISPVRTWSSHASLFYSNWLNYFVYQETPYDISKTF